MTVDTEMPGYPRPFALVLAASVAVLVTTGGSPALAGAWASGSSTPNVGTPSRGDVEQEPSAAEIQAEEEAAALGAQAEQQAAAAGEAHAVLASLAHRATLALERYGAAVRIEQQAQLDEGAAEGALLQAQLDLAAARSALGRWVRQAYLGGGALAESPTAVTLLDGGSTDDLGMDVALLRWVGDSKARAIDDYESASRTQVEALAQAHATTVAATDAAVASAAAKSERDAAVAAQQRLVDALDASTTTARTAAAAAARRAALLAQARAIAAKSQAGVGLNQVTGTVGDCLGGDVSQYSNGEIPLAVLCPLWGAPGQYLRADAAYAFNRLSQAYAQTFGAPICVTDSYRTYQSQVRLYQDKPNLAAVPGTSNHGWARATDLCAGIESFGTRTHNWMLLNAPLFGWFHPVWAEPYGSRPEAWHWEFGGQ